MTQTCATSNGCNGFNNPKKSWNSSISGTMALSLSFLFVACSSPPVLMTAKDITVERKAAAEDCREIGKIMGRSNSIKATPEEALEDMKKEAAQKGANYVFMQETSGLGGAVTGIAYFCP